MHARVRDALQQARESQASINVPAEFVDPYPLVRASTARLKRCDGRDHLAGVRSAPKEVLDLQVTRNTLDRALLLMDTLLKSLEPSGFTARVDKEKRKTLLVGGGTTLTISIVEQVTRTSHAPTRAEEEEEERRRRSYEEARARYEAQVRSRNEERRQLHALFRDASRLQRANRLREFIAAVENRARHDDELTPEKLQWIE